MDACSVHGYRINTNYTGKIGRRDIPSYSSSSLSSSGVTMFIRQRISVLGPVVPGRLRPGMLIWTCWPYSQDKKIYESFQFFKLIAMNEVVR